MYNIEIKPEHRRWGIRYNPQYCPIAIALREVWQDDRIFVTHEEVFVGEIRYRASIELASAVAAFDRGAEFPLGRVYLNPENRVAYFVEV